ncbi:hypothetical protein LXL04_012460 [Taraxacum kok-saghyz]
MDFVICTDLNLSKVMENSQITSSVIAMLMGLDETPPQQQTVSRHQRVLSDNYLQKSGSIGKRPRTYSQSNLLRSKKRANQRTNDSHKDILSRDVEHSKSFSLDGTQGMKSENGIPNIVNVEHASRPLAWEAKKQLLERLKMTKVSQTLSLKNIKSTSRSDFGSSIGIIRNEDWKHESATKLAIFKRWNFSSNLTEKSVKGSTSDVKSSSGELMNFMPTNTMNTRLVLNSSTDDGESFHGDTKEGCSSKLSDLSSEQDSTIRSNEDGLIYLSYEQITEEHPTDNKIETYHHSPNSVLEPPFREDNSSSSDYCETSSNDLYDLWMEDDFGPEMATSSDDERSCTRQTLSSTILTESTESRDFSYLIDVLDESGFQYNNVEIRFEKWHSSECMASQSIFDKLEKKYGKQDLWHKSERKLLFDRINSGMIELLRPRIDIHVCPNSLQRKMRYMSRRDVIEEELSMFLLRQEKGVNDGVSEKAVGREPWFDPADELDSLVTEIEFFLFDMLTTDKVDIDMNDCFNTISSVFIYLRQTLNSSIPFSLFILSGPTNNSNVRDLRSSPVDPEETNRVLDLVVVVPTMEQCCKRECMTRPVQ